MVACRHPQPVLQGLQLKVVVRQDRPKIGKGLSNRHPVICATSKVKVAHLVLVFPNEATNPLFRLRAPHSDEKCTFLWVGLHTQSSENSKDILNILSHLLHMFNFRKLPFVVHVICVQGAIAGSPATSILSIQGLRQVSGKQPPEIRRQHIPLTNTTLKVNVLGLRTAATPN